MTSVNTVNNQNDNKFRNFAIGTAGAVIGYEAEPYIKRGLLYPVRKKIGLEIKTIQGGGFKPYIEKALKQNGLENKLNVIDLNTSNAEAVKKQLGLTNIKSNATSKIIYHLMRLPNNITKSFNRTLNGANAFFSTKHNAVVCNFDKFGAPIFHEIGHKLNSQSKNFFVKTLSKIRNPLAVFGTIGVSTVAMLTKPKSERKETKGIGKLNGFIKDNCGLIATGMMLPLTIEEIIASVKGGKIAKETGLTGDLLKKVQKAHKISMASYIAGALATGLGVYLASKLRDYICNFNKNKA
jgi:hypothetical protein